jgi:Sporulation and spore germination
MRPSQTRPRVLTGVGGLAVLGSALFLAGCGLPTDSSPRDIPPEFVLDAASTVAPVVPSTTGPRAYFLSGPPGQPGTLLPVSRQVSPSAILQSLFDGLTTSEQQTRGLRTAIPEDTELLDAPRVLPDGTARIDVSDDIFSASSDATIEAVAQIVFTATDSLGASRVELLVDGERRAWPRGDGSLEEGTLTEFMYPALNPSSRPDYPPLIDDGGPVATTTTTSTTTIAASTTSVAARTTTSTTAPAG